MERTESSRPEDSAERLDPRRQVPERDGADDSVVHAEIVVDDHVPYPDGLSPGNLGIRRSSFVRDVARGLAEGLNEVGHRKANVFVRLPGFVGQPLTFPCARTATSSMCSR